jgi:S-(hydroxymethyl)glutathione dehydrogenase/alcohol dehydrogenase
MAELMVVNQERLIPIFSDVSSLELAMLPCTGNAGLGMVMAKTPVEPGSDVVVFGAGPVGLSAIQGANIKGAARIIVVEPIRYRRELALKLGGTDGVDPNQYTQRSGPVQNFAGINGDFYKDALVDHLRDMLKQKTDRTFAGGGRIGPDHVVEAAGGNAYGGVTTTPSAGGGPDPTGMTVLSQVWHLCSQVGTAVTCSIGFPPGAMMQVPANQFCDGAKHWRGGTGGGTNIRRDVPRYVKLMECGKLNMKALAQRTYPLAQATEAYRVAMNREVVATIVTPNAS